jgi:hypothetical protein
MAKRSKANGHGNAGHNSGTIWNSRIYNSIESDPEIANIQKLWHKQSLSSEGDLAMLAGTARTTVHNMFSGKTRRPQHATFCKLAGAMGHRYGLQPVATPDYEAELQKARGDFKLHKATLAKRKARRRKP